MLSVSNLRLIEGWLTKKSSASSMVNSNSSSLIINYNDLLQFDIDLARLLIEKPDEIFIQLNDAALETLYFESSVHAESIKDQIQVRIHLFLILFLYVMYLVKNFIV